MSLFFSRRPGRRPGVVGGALLGLLAAPTVTLAQMPDAGTSEVHEAEMATVEAGPFDNGKMWTFEYPPSGYFQEAYDLTPDEAWWAKARTAALRIPSCSASLVSPNGLVMTNHHCAREFVSQVSREGETLLDQGFYATSLEEERSVEDFTADQLIDIVDVTDEVYAALEGIEDNQARSARREEITEEIAARIREERGGEDASIDVEMISLWNGARYSAYVFKQYTEVKLVMAPELQIGFFGGDPDNFTFPRYNLDMSFFRIYEDGQPLQTDTYFEWDDDGVVEGEPIFIIGNPGSTSRLQTVAELEFRRDAADAGVLAFVRSRAELLEEFTAAHPEVAETLDLRNEAFSLRNSEKAYGGILRGLSDPAIIARRADSERRFQEAIEANPELATEYGGLIERLAELQDQKRPEAGGYFAFLGMTAPKYASATLRRALYGFQYLQMQGRVSEEALEEVKNEFLAVEQLPPELDEALIRARIDDLQLGYGEDAPFLQEMLAARTPEGLAAIVHQSSVLSDSAGAVAALENGMLSMADPALEFFAGFLRPFGAFQTVLAQTGPEEEEIAAALGRARFEVYGTDVPPDATFSLRIADGVVTGYEYNGTQAPIHTTFYGLYDRHYSHGEDEEWALPERWLSPPATLDLSTPVNFVATADIIGGNSGSPVLDRDLRVVGLVFDGNIESLPGDYIYLPEQGNRSVSVDARGILAALDHVYDADRLVVELTSGQLVPTEAEADAMR
jgi:hypothetical protein